MIAGVGDDRWHDDGRRDGGGESIRKKFVTLPCNKGMRLAQIVALSFVTTIENIVFLRPDLHRPGQRRSAPRSAPPPAAPPELRAVALQVGQVDHLADPAAAAGTEDTDPPLRNETQPTREVHPVRSKAV